MKLSRDFYERNTLKVAKELLGKYLVHVTSEATLIGKIVETEAYCGFNDAAAHSYKGLRSNRTEVMFGPGGYAYVYLIYGMYYCFNIVTSSIGNPEAVLIRALEPVSGIDVMKKNRKTDNLYNLCSGPGKLCIAMNITKEHNNVDLCGNELYLLDNSKVPEDNIISAPRINIDYAGEAKNYPWRFVIKDSKYLSVPVK